MADEESKKKKKKKHMIYKIKYKSNGAILFGFTEAEGELLYFLYVNFIFNCLKEDRMRLKQI